MSDDDQLAIPAFLRRPVTDEALARVAAIVEEDRRRHGPVPSFTQAPRPPAAEANPTRTEMKGPPGSKEKALRELRERGPKHDKPTGQTLKALVAEKTMKTAEPSNSAPAGAAGPSAPKETAVKKKTTKTSTKSKKPAPAKKTPKAKAAKAKAPKVAAGKKNARAGSPARSDGPRPGSKLEIVRGLLMRPEGCTTADILAATEWPSVSVPAQAKAAGLVLSKEKDGKVTRYRGAATV